MIVVIGGGWSGCAAAVALARGGCAVELREAAGTLGGRARCVVRDGLPLDNGEHLLLGAYAETLALAAAIRDGASTSAWTIKPLVIRPLSRAQRNAVTLTTHRLPGPLGPLTGLFGARGLRAGERIATLRWFARQRRRQWQCDANATVADLLADLPGAVVEKLWNPLCVAALNTPPARASARLFLNVLRATFASGANASAIVAPREGLAEAVPARASAWLANHGHVVRTSARTRIVAIDAHGVSLESAGATTRAEAAIIAVAPHQLAAVFAPGIERSDPRVRGALADVSRFDYEPITTVYLGYAEPVALPRGLVRLDDAPGQWLFARDDILRRASAAPNRAEMRALLSVVMSARGSRRAPDHRALVRALDRQLRRLATSLPPLVWSQVIEEKRATYACTPALARPECGRLAPRLYLAGDYTDPDLPATLEAAVKSGRIAAEALIHDRADDGQESAAVPKRW